jgi:hypothetical protein
MALCGHTATNYLYIVICRNKVAKTVTVTMTALSATGMTLLATASYRDSFAICRDDPVSHNDSASPGMILPTTGRTLQATRMTLQ